MLSALFVKRWAMFSQGQKFAADGLESCRYFGSLLMSALQAFTSVTIPDKSEPPKGNKPSPGVQMYLAVASRKWPPKCRGRPHVGTWC